MTHTYDRSVTEERILVVTSTNHFTADSSVFSVESYGGGHAGMYLQSLSLVRFGEWPSP